MNSCLGDPTPTKYQTRPNPTVATFVAAKSAETGYSGVDIQATIAATGKTRALNQRRDTTESATNCARSSGRALAIRAGPVMPHPKAMRTAAIDPTDCPTAIADHPPAPDVEITMGITATLTAADVTTVAE
ncbi:hypothetical protein GCM10007170_06320 [Arthrobacter liuii]|uniref:Uncharacterized protein n=1 Tax=Arthrobacter liuii TaxID=1476996 RepID=A0ABQ2AFV7_9MICC|nr:hypothetical protein GCM10007170_06320 [Arthrobacter liuii]